MKQAAPLTAQAVLALYTGMPAGTDAVQLTVHADGRAELLALTERGLPMGAALRLEVHSDRSVCVVDASTERLPVPEGARFHDGGETRQMLLAQLARRDQRKAPR